MEFKLPEIGEGLQEGELISWLVKEGDTVATDQALLEVMTDKATVEVPATSPGVVKELKAKEGDMIKVGQTLAVIEEGSSATAAAPQATAPETSAVSPKDSVPSQTPSNGNGKGYGIFAEEDTTSAVPTSHSNTGGPYVQAQDSLKPTNIPAAPLVRAMAQKAGVDLSQVSGSGPSVGGVQRILEQDLVKFLDNQSSSQAVYQAPSTSATSKTPAKPASPSTPVVATKALPANQFNFSEEVERKPLRGLRRVISQAMTKSKFTAPHYAYVDDFECSELTKLKDEAKAAAAEYGIKISYLPFIVKALVGALKEFPIANSSLEETDSGSEIVYKKFYHIGIAVATDEGLVVPVIKHADKKSILQIAKEIHELSAKTRAGKATADELRGSTFTITSMGNLAGKFATPIINYPEVGIMGVYRAEQKPIVKDGQIVVGNVMPLSLSLDHRVVDGAVGSQFCSAIIDRLKNPAKLMLEMI